MNGNSMQIFFGLDLIAWRSAGIGFIIGSLLIGICLYVLLKLRWQRFILSTSNQLTHLETQIAEQKERIEDFKAHIHQQEEKLIAQQNDIITLTSERAAIKEQALRLPVLENELAENYQQIDNLKQENTIKMAQLAELNMLIEQERRQTEDKIALLLGAKEQLSNEFMNLANKIFEDKSLKFNAQNREQMDAILTPLKEQIFNFRRKIEDVYDHESRDRISMLTEIRHLKELNQRISKDADNLTQALKGDSKIQGNWGEVILTRLLESSGLHQGREYEMQVSLKNSDNRRYQPDVIVHLPDGKNVIIDAKVSLKSYERYYNATEEKLKEKALKAHIESLRTHIRGLGDKSYQDLPGIQSLDFVLLFVPIEAAFLAAVNSNPDLFQYAFDRNIMVVGPSTLLIALRIIQNIWSFEYQNRHAREIAHQAGNLYDKFIGFVSALEEIGHQLDRAQEAYGNARKRLTDGRGNLITRVQGLIQLGVKAQKEMPQELMETALESDHSSKELQKDEC